MMRLDKFLCDCRAGTRSEVKKYIKQGAISVNGVIANRPEVKIDEAKDQITFHGKLLEYEKYSYYMLYKEAGSVTAVSDSRHKTVMEELPENLRGVLTPVGRLDQDTEGLLLLTNDGAFTHHILSPTHHVEKTYEAKLDNPVPPTAVEDFSRGIDIGDEDLTLPAELVILPDVILDDGTREYGARLTISEGRYHQVKRMFSTVGCKVIGLKRLSIHTLTLEGLAPGEYRKLTPEEVQSLWGEANHM